MCQFTDCKRIPSFGLIWKKPTHCSKHKLNQMINVVKDYFQYEGHKLRVYGNVSDPWFCGKDVAKILGYTNHQKAIRVHVNINDKLKFELLIQKESFFKDNHKTYRSNELNTIYINKSGLKTILIYSKQCNKTQFIKWCYTYFNVYIYNLTRLGKEQEYIGYILKVFKHKNIQTQYVIQTYRIDLYFVDDCVAVECDEFGHKDRNPTYEINRQNTIQEQLKCVFVRFNPDDIHFCIFKVIHNILIKLT